MQPETRGSPGASRAAHLSSLEWEPAKSPALCPRIVTAPTPGEALEKKEDIMFRRKSERERKQRRSPTNG